MQVHTAGECQSRQLSLGLLFIEFCALICAASQPPAIVLTVCQPSPSPVPLLRNTRPRKISSCYRSRCIPAKIWLIWPMAKRLAHRRSCLAHSRPPGLSQKGTSATGTEDSSVKTKLPCPL